MECNVVIVITPIQRFRKYAVSYSVNIRMVLTSKVLRNYAV